jgi:hypothetical protein
VCSGINVRLLLLEFLKCFSFFLFGVVGLLIMCVG